MSRVSLEGQSARHVLIKRDTKGCRRMLSDASDATEPLNDDGPTTCFSEVAYHKAGHVLVDLDTGRRFHEIYPPATDHPRPGFMCHDQPRGGKHTFLRACAGPCAQALYRWQVDGDEVAVLLPPLRTTPVSLSAAIHERTGQSLDHYLTQAFRSGGYLDYTYADRVGLLASVDDDETDYDDQEALAETCDFLISRWPLLEHIATALCSSRTPLSYKDVSLLRTAPPTVVDRLARADDATG